MIKYVFSGALILCFFGLKAQNENEFLSWRQAYKQDASFYSTAEAIRIADNLLFYQHPNGGWTKNIDMAKPLSEEEISEIRLGHKDPSSEWSETTIDNRATFTQLKFLGKVYKSTLDERYKTGFLRGIEYLLEAQYENGGWPQFYPLRDGYYSDITFNDGAMIGVLFLLKDVVQGKYSFVNQELRSKCEASVEKGVDIILKTQIIVEGKRTAWCAQYNPLSLQPSKARSYELISISGSESVGIVKFLMEIENPSFDVIEAVNDAVEWFEKSKIQDIRIIRFKDDSAPKGWDIVVGFDPESKVSHWARFYEIGTNYPMFIDRDGVVKYSLSQIGVERRTGYKYLGMWANELLEKDYPEWKSKHGIK